MTGRERSLRTYTEPAMGTMFSFTLVLPAGSIAAPLSAPLAAARSVLHKADEIFSTWDTGSPVSRFRRGEARLRDLPPAVAEVIRECRSAHRASAGWFDPWAMPGGFDPTGLVKGWAVDRALAVLRQAGLPGAMINGGGDVAAFGSPAPGEPWRVGIQHPWRADSLAAVVEVDSAVATSGSYERGPHLIDPWTGLPAIRSTSATVTAPSLAVADALATALAVGGEEALPVIGAVEGCGAYLILPDGTEAEAGRIRFARSNPEVTV